MKKFSFLVLALVLAFSFIACDSNTNSSTATDTSTVNELGFAGGSGTESDPYLIATTEQFELLKQYGNLGYSFKVTQDISVPATFHMATFKGQLQGADSSTTVTFTGNSPSGSDAFVFWALDSSTISNITFDLGSKGKSFASCTGGDVTFDTVTMKADMTGCVNNEGGFINFVGYGDYDYRNRKGANVVFKNCVSEVNYTDPYLVSWGHGPFVSAYGMPGVEEDSSLTLENCTNNAEIRAGKVGFAFGNQSGVEKLKSVVITNCKNGTGGVVYGLLDAGGVSWGGKDSNSTNNVRVSGCILANLYTKGNVSEVSASYENGKITFTGVDAASNATGYTWKVIEGFYYENYEEDNTNPSHCTNYYEVGYSKSSDNKTLTLNAVKTIDAKGYTASASDGDVVTLYDTKYIYHATVVDAESKVVHSCANSTTHIGDITVLVLLGYDSNSNLVFCKKPPYLTNSDF